jgi:prepilin-type N-terminal cleavage/methylation domain-containing protein
MPQRHPIHNAMEGFTLVEMAIVLVVIGLVVGAIFVGRDLIGAGQIRATVSQLDKYNAVVTTFRLKYNTMPGDMTPDNAAAYGFQSRSGAPGHGDGNGYLANCNDDYFASAGQVGCELGLFWHDLSDANLVTGGFQGTDNWAANLTAATVGQYFPATKCDGTYVAAYGMGQSNVTPGQGNWFTLAGIQATDATGFYTLTSTLTPRQVSAIDTKIDDGLPGSGVVIWDDPGGCGGSNNLRCQDTGPTLCAKGFPPIYNTTLPYGDMPLCGLFFKMTQ